MVESAAIPGIDSRFKLDPEIEESGYSRAAAIYGISKLMENAFGGLEKITVDHEDAKLMLLALRNGAGLSA